MHTLAVDIGGTKLDVGVVDDAGRVVRRARRPTRAHGDAELLFGDLVGLVDEVVAGAPADEILARCGVGCGGPMAEGGVTVSPLNITAWRDFPLRARLADHVGLPVDVDNDAKALALAEGWLGAAVGHRDYVALVVSTGVGGGIVSRGRLLDGASGNAGHIGHVFVAEGTTDWERHPAGLLETEASGTAIAQRTGRSAAHAPPEVRVRVGTLVGRAVASVANLLDLRLAVVAGSVALGYGDDFFTAAQAEVDRLVRARPLARCPHRPGRARCRRAPGRCRRRGAAGRWGGHRRRLNNRPEASGRACQTLTMPSRGRHRVRHRPSPRRTGVTATVRAVLARPTHWPAALRQARALVPAGWWRRRPFLPLPDRQWLRFRSVTAYGDPGAPLDAEDVCDFLAWTSTVPPAAGPVGAGTSRRRPEEGR